jgi:hypothetical protein
VVIFFYMYLLGPYWLLTPSYNLCSSLSPADKPKG